MKQIDTLTKCMMMIMKSGVAPETPKSKWPHIILYSHTRGYLWTNKDQSIFVCIYRIPLWEEKWKHTIPNVESGDIAFVNFCVSESDNKYSLLKMLKDYIADTGVEEIIYYYRNTNQLKRMRTKHERQISFAS